MVLLQYIPQLTAQKHIVLASASPRRREILGNIGLKFDIHLSTFDELLPHSRYAMAADYAVATAREKAVEVARMVSGEQASTSGRTPADLVIGADTVVELDGQILEKPTDATDAVAVLSRLSGRQHRVHTGVALVLPKAPDPTSGQPPYVHTFSSTTSVRFDTLSPACIEAYVATGEPFGKAGSYGIQGAAGSFVTGIDGCYNTVVGFPLHRFSAELASLIEGGMLPLQAPQPAP